MTGQAGAYQLAGTAFLTNVSGQGVFTAELLLPPVGPAYAKGTYNITAEDGIDGCGSAPFTLNSSSLDVPQLTIAYPTSGIVGTATSVSGLYFSDSMTINPITMGGDTLSCSGGNPVTSSIGAFGCDFTIPQTLSAGTYPVIATDPTYGPISSTNEFTDTGGQTTTVIDCSPNPIGTSSSYAPSYYLRASSNCTAIVTDPGGAHLPTGTVTMSSSSTTGIFFTWIWTGKEYSYTPTTICTLDAESQCSIYYADSIVGLPTITGDYSGDTYNAAGSGTDPLLVVPITAPSVTASCDPSFVSTSSSCTATVTGSSPTGTVTWTPYNAGMPTATGFFSPTICTLVGGSCSVTYHSPAIYYTSCPSDSTWGCSSPIILGAQYDGDPLNAPAYGEYTVAIGLTGDQYDSYASGVVAELPLGIMCDYCRNVSGETGGMATQTASFSEHVSGLGVADMQPIAVSDAFAVMGAAQTGEISATGTSSNAGDAEGSVFIADTVTVTGQCDVSGNPDPGNLLDCLGISLSVSGDVQADCDNSNGGCAGAANAIAGGNFEMCDLNQPTTYGYACASGSYGGEACAGSTCAGPCPAGNTPESVCVYEGSASLDFQSPPPVFFGPDTTISSGDSLYLSESIGGTVEDTALGGASLNIDPSFKIVNLDPSGVSVSIGAAEVIALANPSVLELSSTITPNPVAAGHPVEENTTITNAGSSTLVSINATGSMDGPLSCPGYDIAPGGNMTCTGTFTPVATGAQIDYIVANGTNGTDADVSNATMAPFTVIPTPYPVTFNETGLAPGTSWSVFVNGTVQNSSTSTINVSLPYGVYSYEVIPSLGYTSTPSNGSFFVFNSALEINLTMAPGPQGPIIAAIAELYSVYDQRTDLQSAFPDANSSLASFTDLVDWAAWVMEAGPTGDSNYSTLAPFGWWYALMGTYNQRTDLQLAFPNAFTDFSNYIALLHWASWVDAAGSTSDSAYSTLASFGPSYTLMATYNGRPDLETAFPNADTNFTNFTDLVNWSSWVVAAGSGADSAYSMLAPYGYWYVLMGTYTGRADLRAAFPDAYTNFASFSDLVNWASWVVQVGSTADSANATLAPYAYWYVLVATYDGRADLQGAFAAANTNFDSYTQLVAWAVWVCATGPSSDNAYATLLPYQSIYDGL